MRNIAKIGASALAMALSITMIAPISANAEVIATWEYDENGKEKNYTFTNEDTKVSYSEKDGYKIIQESEEWEYIDLTESYGTWEDIFKSELKVKTISTKSYNETETFTTSLDVARFENFKSNKNGLKVKVISRQEYNDPTPAAEKVYMCNFTDKDGNAYYRNVNGEIVKVEKKDLDTKLPKGTDIATYVVRFYAKKAGTYKVSYDAKLKDGTTVKKTFKVIAKEDGSAIKSVTFGGQLLDVTVGTDSFDKSDRVWTKGYGINTTSKKSGKIRVTMNKDFKLKKIEVGTPVMITKDEKGYLTRCPEYSTSTIHDGVYTWKKVKNGKKIKLSKVDTSRHSIDKKTESIQEKQTSTVTLIRITYYDKKNKTTERAYIPISKVQK